MSDVIQISETQIVVVTEPLTATVTIDSSENPPVQYSIQPGSDGIAVATSGNDTLVSLADDTAAIEALNTTGIPYRFFENQWKMISLVPPGAGITISSTGPDYNQVFELTGDLLALESMATTGLAIRSNTDTWITRALTGTVDQITITNGTGVDGDPAVSLSPTIRLPGSLSAASGNLRMLDTDASHEVSFAIGSDITEDRTLTFVTGDANRTIDVSAGSPVFTAFGLGLINNADAAEARSALNLNALASLTSPGADAMPYFSGASTATTTTLTGFARTLLDDEDAAAARTTLELNPVASVVPTGANTIPYFSGTDTADLTAFTPFARTLLEDVDASAARGTLGINALATLEPTVDTIPYFDSEAAAETTALTAFARGLLGNVDAAEARETLGLSATILSDLQDLGPTLSAGDLITAGGTDNITRLAAGAAGAFLRVLSGAPAWDTTPVFGSVAVRQFTTTGTYTPTSGMVACLAFAIGAGGGAGGAATGAAAAMACAGGGGAAGSLAIGIFTAAQIGTSKPVLVGAKGIGGTGNAAGTAGGYSGLGSSGSLLKAEGGAGGAQGYGTAAGHFSGAGAVSTAASLGSVKVAGGSGDDGDTFYASATFYGARGGKGGAGFFGGAGRSIARKAGGGAQAGSDGLAPGAGGTGAVVCSSSSGVQAKGGDGSTGIVIIIEFIKA